MVHLVDLKLVASCTVLKGTAKGTISASGVTVLWVLQRCVCGLPMHLSAKLIVFNMLNLNLSKVSFICVVYL